MTFVLNQMPVLLLAAAVLLGALIPATLVLWLGRRRALHEGSVLRSGLKALSRDLDRSQAETGELRRSRDALRVVQFSVDHAPDPVYWIGPDARFLYVNEAACRALGFSRAELLAMTVFDVDPSFSREQWAGHWEDLKARGSYSFETVHRTKQGRDFPVEVTANLAACDGREYNFAVARDITARRLIYAEGRRLEQQALQLKKWESLGVMAGGIAHDFNNLLVGVMGNAEVALDMLPPDSPVRPYLEDIRSSGLRSSELIGQMMTFAGQGRFRIEQVSVDGLVRAMEPLLHAAVPKKVALRLDLPEQVTPVEADISQLRQAIMNVVLNAAEAIGTEVGEIAVRVRAMHADRAELAQFPTNPELPEGDYVAIEIADSGPGIDATALQNLFDPFFSTKFAGRGLGLSAVLGILRGHHGAVKATSAPGRGSTFTLLFPAAAPESRRTASDAPPTPARPESRTVLVVDDEEAVRRVTQRMLEQSGYTVLTAHDGRTAADVFWAHRQQVTAVILDVAMPTLGGEEIFLILRNIRPDVPILLASGYSEDEARRRFGARNVDGFIKKPFRAADLVDALEQVLSGRR